MPIIFKTLKEEDPALKKMLLSRLIIVGGMVILMSFYGAIVSVGLYLDILLEWPKNMVLNFIVAYPLQVLVARPLVGFVFRKAFPIGPLQDLFEFNLLLINSIKQPLFHHGGFLFNNLEIKYL